MPGWPLSDTGQRGFEASLLPTLHELLTAWNMHLIGAEYMCSFWESGIPVALGRQGAYATKSQEKPGALSL